MQGKGFLMAGGVFMGGYIGYLGTKVFKSSPAITAVVVLVGMLAGARIGAKAIAELEKPVEVV